MIPFYLVTGFLGSGKTTLLQNIMREYSERERIAIIQNEFAPSGTDGKQLKMEGGEFKLVEINNGSVFCACMLGTFIQSLRKLIEDYNPGIIFLEASGLADPLNIIELLQEDTMRNYLTLDRVFCIVDAPNFERGLSSIGRFRHQLMIADTILVNKTDLYPGELFHIHEKIKTINPYADIFNTSYCKLEPERFLNEQEFDHLAAKTFGMKESEGRPSMKACVLRIHTKISIEGIEAFVRELMPGCPRIKGFVNTKDNRVMSIQSVFDIFEYREIPAYTGPTEIIAFGEDITPGMLRKSFLKYS